MKTCLKVAVSVASLALIVGCAPQKDVPYEKEIIEVSSSVSPTSSVSSEESDSQVRDGEAELVVNTTVGERGVISINVKVINVGKVYEVYDVLFLTDDNEVKGGATLEIEAGENGEFTMGGVDKDVNHVRLDGKILGEDIAGVEWN